MWKFVSGIMVLAFPQDIIDKVFNPFFTTKPAGQGTGLGLSLSFDIVVQEHHGEMKVDSKEGEYAEFVIKIPKNLVSILNIFLLNE